jgi:hypothetical protein
MLKIDTAYLNFTKLLTQIFKPDFIGASIPSPISERRYTISILINPPIYQLSYKSDLFRYDLELSATITFRFPSILKYEDLPIQLIEPYIQYAAESLVKLDILQLKESDWGESLNVVWVGSLPEEEVFTTVALNQEVLIHESNDWLIQSSLNLQSQWVTEDSISAPLTPLPTDLNPAIITRINMNLFRESLSNNLTVNPVEDGYLDAK